MSYILDALKKSEQRREFVRILTPGRAAPVLSTPVQLIIIGFGLLVVLAALGLWWHMDTRDSTVDPLPAEEAVAAMTTQPKEPERPEPKRNKFPERKGTDVPAPKKTDLAIATLPARPAVNELVEQTRVVPPKGKVSKARKKVSKARKKVARAQMSSPKPAAGDINKQYRDTGRDQLEADAAVPYLRQMPNDFRRNLPDMVLNIHLYSADESENLVYINNRQYRRGERIEGRIRLERIVPEGVILNYNGTRFKLPRPN